MRFSDPQLTYDLLPYSKVNEGLEDELCIFGFEVVRWRTLALNLCIVLTAGLLWLPLYWVPRWKLLLTHRRVPLDKATSVLVEVQNYTVCGVPLFVMFC